MNQEIIKPVAVPEALVEIDEIIATMTKYRDDVKRLELEQFP